MQGVAGFEEGGVRPQYAVTKRDSLTAELLILVYLIN